MKEEEAKYLILIIEDEAPVRMLLTRYLTSKGFDVVAVGSGKEGLEELSQKAFDLVLLDMILPDAEDFELLKKIRDRFTQEDLPIVMFTGQSRSEKVVEGFELGVNDFITKPADFKVVQARLTYQLNARKPKAAKRNESEPFRISIGSKLIHYKILELLGKGGMGVVYKAMDERLERIVALKSILPNWDVEHELIDRFTQEAKIVAKLNHPNIIQVYDIAEEPVKFFSMAYIDGGPLSKILKGEGLKLEESIQITLKMCSALAAAHDSGVIHRDLKPSNIMMDLKGEPHLTDFGMAKILESNLDFTKTQDMIGTPGNMAPEQIDPTLGQIDPRTDIFGLGTIFYEMLAGKPPFQGTPANILWQVVYKEPASIEDLNPEVSSELADVCYKAMNKEQDERYQTAKEFAEAIKAASASA